MPLNGCHERKACSCVENVLLGNQPRGNSGANRSPRVVSLWLRLHGSPRTARWRLPIQLARSELARRPEDHGLMVPFIFGIFAAATVTKCEVKSSRNAAEILNNCQLIVGLQ